MVRVLVTGHKGFVGSWIAEHLESCGHTIIGMDMADGVDMLYPGSWPLDVIMRDKVDAVLHVAAEANLYHAQAKARSTYETNVMGTLNVAGLAARLGARLLYISTCCAYGSANKPGVVVHEGTIPEPTELYAQSKLAGEQAAAAYGKPTIFRIGTVLGPRMRKALFNYQALDKVHKGEIVTVYGAGTQTRQYIHARDIAEAVGLWLASDAVGTFNICGEEQTSVLDTIRIAGEVVGRKPAILFASERPGEFSQRILCDRARQAFGWAPRTSFRDAMHETYAWYKGER